MQIHNDMGARQRIERHAEEVVREGEMSKRATATGSFAGLVPPQYLISQAALIQRASRPFANSVQRLPLPEEGMQLIIPRGTTGASAAIQASENASVSNTDEVWANLTLPVVTCAGQMDVSRQSLERGAPGIDALVYQDLTGAYATALDQQVLSGTGSSGQVLGVFNTSGINQATAFGAAAAVGTLFTKVAGQISAVTSTRYVAPNSIALHPRRAAWLEAQTDTTGRPLVGTGLSAMLQSSNTMGGGDSNSDLSDYGTGGTFLGLRAVVDANVPTAAGSGPEDQIIVYRAEDLMLWEDGDGTPRELRFEQTLGNQLTVKLVAYGYFAFTAGRYPSAVGIVGGNATAGNGLVAPSF